MLKPRRVGADTPRATSLPARPPRPARWPAAQAI